MIQIRVARFCTIATYLEENIILMKKLKKITVLSVASLFVVSNATYVLAAPFDWPPVLRPVNTTDFSATIETSIATVEESMLAHNVTGLTVALVDAETGFTWTQGFGYADTTIGALVDEHTLFQIGSTSKPFTAISVMQLVEQEIIDLDEPIVTYLPEFSMLPSFRYGGNSDNITVRMLLNNTSGIMVDYIRAFLMTGNIPYQGAMNDVLTRLHDREMHFEEGTRWEYANQGWTLLGALVARMTGHDNYFEGFVQRTQEAIFTPLGMNRSTFYFTPNLTNVALSYLDSEHQDDFTIIPLLSAGGMFSSSHDMARFMHAMLGDGTLNGNRLLESDTISYMLQSHTDHLDMPAVMSYGLGFMQLNLPSGLSTVGHGGNILHYHTEMIFSLEHGLGVFVSTNSLTGVHVASPVAVAILEAAIAEKSGSTLAYNETEVDMANAQPIDLPRESLETFIQVFGGFYDFGEGGQWYLGLTEQGLVWEMDQLLIELTPLSDGSFDAPLVGGHYVFSLDDDVVTATLVTPAGDLLGTRIENPVSSLEVDIPESILPWLGVYTFVPQLENERSTISSVEIFVNDAGTIMFRQHSHLGVGMMPLAYYEGRWFATSIPLLFSMENGVATLDLLGGQFVRE